MKCGATRGVPRTPKMGEGVKRERGPVGMPGFKIKRLGRTTSGVWGKKRKTDAERAVERLHKLLQNEKEGWAGDQHLRKLSGQKRLY